MNGKHREAIVTTLAAVLLSAALSAAGSALAANPGNPAVFEGEADANVLSLISIGEDANLDFGRIIAPESGTQEFTVTPAGAMVEGAGTGQAVGGHEPGQYDITGTAGEEYTLTMAADGCSNANLQLSGIVNNAPVPTILNQLDVKVGGTLTVASAISPGSYTCNYSIQAEYP